MRTGQTRKTEHGDNGLCRSAVLQALNQASGSELYRLRAAIDRVLADPKWIQAVQSQLRIGQEITFFDARANGLLTAEVLDFRKKEVLVRQLDTDERWLIAYTCINLDGADVRIREEAPRRLSRQAVAVGDTVGFLDRAPQGCRLRYSNEYQGQEELEGSLDSPQHHSRLPRSASSFFLKCHQYGKAGNFACPCTHN